MTAEFGKKSKQGLADLLGGELVFYDSAIAIDRGRDQFRIDFYGDPHDDRLLGCRIQSSLDRAEKQGAGAGDRHDSRPRVDGLPTLLLRRQTVEDRKGSRFGLNRVVQTAYPDFDKLVYVESDAPDEHIQTVLQSEETRSIVKTLLDQRCKSVGLNTTDGELHGELVVKFQTLVPDADSLPRLAEELNRLFETIRSLRASLPLFVGDAKAARRFWLLKGAYWIEAFLIVLGGVSFGVTASLEKAPVDALPLFILLGGGFGAAVLFVPLAFLFARGHSRGAGHFLGLVLVGLVAFPAGALGLGVGTNGLLDTSRPQAYSVVVLADPELCDFGTHSSHAVPAQDWRDSRRTFVLNLDNPALCDATKRGDTFVVVVREGFLGWPWLSDIQPPR